MDNTDKVKIIKSKLGEPYFEIPWKCVLYKEDCFLWLKKIDQKVFDWTITSPPYNIWKEYETVVSVDAYIKWTADWISLVYQCSKDESNFLLNVWFLETEKWKCVPIPYLMRDKVDFYMIQEIIRNYWAWVACKNRLSPRNEKVLRYAKNKDNYIFNLDPIRDPNVKYPNSKKNWKLRTNPLGKNPSDVWYIPKITTGTNRSSKERAPHPAQFPMTLIDRLVKWFSNKWDFILDPFMWSGTTWDVCLRNDRLFLWFEVMDKYIEYAKWRLWNTHDEINNKLI